MTNLIYARNIVYKRILLSKYTVLCVPKKYNFLQNIKFDVNFFASVCVCMYVCMYVYYVCCTM